MIYVPNYDLADWQTGGTYAHELTHVYQDQVFAGPGTVTAAQEHLNHFYGDGHNPYKVELGPSTNWPDLGVEEQAMVVQYWQIYKKYGLIVNDNKIDTDPVNAYYQNVLKQAGFFGL